MGPEFVMVCDLITAIKKLDNKTTKNSRNQSKFSNPIDVEKRAYISHHH